MVLAAREEATAGPVTTTRDRERVEALYMYIPLHTHKQASPMYIHDDSWHATGKKTSPASSLIGRAVARARRLSHAWWDLLDAVGAGHSV